MVKATELVLPAVAEGGVRLVMDGAGLTVNVEATVVESLETPPVVT
jgi:hypothetical protein